MAESASVEERPTTGEGKASLLRSAVSDATHAVDAAPASVDDDAEGDAPAGGLTIDECLDRIGFGSFQLKLGVVSGLGYLADTAELLFVTFLLPEFSRTWPNLTRAQLSLIPALSAAGTLVSAPAWGLASDLLGRRRVFVGSMGLVAAAGLSGALAPGFWPFVATRVLVGAGLGGALSIDFILFIEFLPAQQRGVGTMLLTMWGVAGVLYVGLLARLVLPYAGWRVYTAAAALPNCALLLLRLRIPESPRFLLLRGRATEAARVLRAVAAENGRGEALPKRLRLAPLPPPPSGRARLRALTRPPLRAPLAALCVVWLGLSSAYAGFTFWLPALLAARGIDGLSASETYLVMTAAEVPGLLLATALIDRLGRRRVLACALLGCAAALSAFARARSHGALVACSACSYFCVVGAWATLYTLTPESFPTAVRATAAGATRLCACVGTMLAAPLGATLLSAGEAAPLVAYASTLGACAAAVLMLADEPSRQPLTERGGGDAAEPATASCEARVDGDEAPPSRPRERTA